MAGAVNGVDMKCLFVIARSAKQTDFGELSRVVAI